MRLTWQANTKEFSVVLTKQNCCEKDTLPEKFLVLFDSLGSFLRGFPEEKLGSGSRSMLELVKTPSVEAGKH